MDFCLLHFSFIYSDSKFLLSDGSGPKRAGPGRARDLKVGLGPGPGLSPSMNAGPRALTALEILLCTAVKKLKFSGPYPKVRLRACSGLGSSPKVGLRAFQKTQASGRAQAGLRPGPITKFI